MDNYSIQLLIGKELSIMRATSFVKCNMQKPLNLLKAAEVTEQTELVVILILLVPIF